MDAPEASGEGQATAAVRFRTVEVDRRADGAEVARFIREAGGGIVLLYGKRASGKTELLRRWVIPELDRSGRVYYAQCSPALPEQAEVLGAEVKLDLQTAPPGIIFIDDFERFLALPPRSMRRQLENLLAAVMAGKRETTLVFVIPDESLQDILVLRSDFPELAQHTYRLRGVAPEDALASIAAADRAAGVRYSPEVGEELKKDLESFTVKSACPLLIQTVHAALAATGAKEITGAGYRAAGGLTGILEERLRLGLAALGRSQGPEAAEAGRAIVEEVAASPGAGASPDLREIAARIGISEAAVSAALAWLKGPDGLLRDAPGETLAFEPDQLADVVAEQKAARERELRGVRRILSEGMRAWTEIGSVLPKGQFEELHRARKDLRTTPDEAAFLLNCPLRYGAEPDCAEARYWLGRMADAESKTAALKGALSDARSEIRARAARVAGEDRTVDVRAELFRMALEDPDEAARSEAVTSLGRRGAGEFRGPLAQQAADPSSACRFSAISALRLFPDQDTAELLEAFVRDRAAIPAVRHAAIETLAAIRTEAAANALADIALADEDCDDREEAAKALARLDSEPLQAGALARIRDARGPFGVQEERAEHRGWWRTPAAVCATALLMAGNLSIGVVTWRLATLTFAVGGDDPLSRAGREMLLFLGFMLVVCAAVVASLSILIERLLGKTRRRKAWRILLFVSNATGIFALVHGMAHMLHGRARRGLQLLGLELLGIGCALSMRVFPDLFTGAVPGPMQTFLVWFYVALGLVALFIGTYLDDILRGARLGLRSPERVEAEERRNRVYRSVLATPAGAAALLSEVGSPNRATARWAAGLVKRFALTIPAEQLMERLRNDREATPAVIARALARVKQDPSISALRDLWPAGTAPLRRRIVGILAAMPTERSLACLRSLLEEGGPVARLRYYAATLDYRLRLWPKLMIFAVVCSLPLVSVLLGEGIATTRNPARPLLKALRGAAIAVMMPGHFKDEKTVTETAMFLARRYPDKSAQRLLEVYAMLDQAEASHLEPVRQSLSESLETIANLGAESTAMAVLDSLAVPLGPEKGSDAQRLRASRILVGIARGSPLPTVQERAGRMLAEHADWFKNVLVSSDQDDFRTDLIDALAAVGSGGALEALVEFATAPNPGLFAGKAGVERSAAAVDAEGRLKVFRKSQKRALVEINRAGTPDSRQALRRVAEGAPPEEIRAEAERIVKQTLISDAQSALQRRDYREALGSANEAIGLDRKDAYAHATRATALLRMDMRKEALASYATAAELSPSFAWARYMQALILYEDKDYKGAEEKALEAVRSDPKNATAYPLLRQIYVDRDEVTEAERQLEALARKYPQVSYPRQQLAYLYHETVSQKDPTGYARAYRVNRRLLEEARDPAERSASEANFVECNLTTGRYREAVKLAREAAASKGISPDRAIAMRLIAYAALAADREYGEAAQELNQLERAIGALPAGSETGWVFDGTLHYIRTQAAMEEPLKSAVIKLIGEINENNKRPAGSKSRGVPKSLEENRAALRAMPAR